MRAFGGFSLTLCWLLAAFPVAAQQEDEPMALESTRYGVGLLLGSAYDPDSFGLVIFQGQLLLDYERISWHAAPPPLRLKFEVNAGMTTDGRQRGLLAVNALALYYLEPYRSGRWTPYVEGGIGLIYTDFQVRGQGLRFNFNPQAGIGAEYALGDNRALTAGVRVHHVSNGHTYQENRGINSVLLTFGYLF